MDTIIISQKIINNGFEINSDIIHSSHNVLRFSLTAFIFISVICANVANVYSASVGWELVAPKALVGRKEYFILGLGITTIFILVSGLFSFEFLLNVTDSSLVNLCIVLLIGYIIGLQQKRLPQFFEQLTYFIAWLASTIINTLQFSHLILSDFPTLLIGFISIVFVMSLSFLGRLFLR